MTSAVITCVHAGRRVKRKTQESQENMRKGQARGGRRPTGKSSMHRQRTHSTERTGSGRTDRGNQHMRQEMELRASATG